MKTLTPAAVNIHNRDHENHKPLERWHWKTVSIKNNPVNIQLVSLLLYVYHLFIRKVDAYHFCFKLKSFFYHNIPCLGKVYVLLSQSTCNSTTDIFDYLWNNINMASKSVGSYWIRPCILQIKQCCSNFFNSRNCPLIRWFSIWGANQGISSPTKSLNLFRDIFKLFF